MKHGLNNAAEMQKKSLQILLQICKKILKNTFRLELDDMCMYHYVEKMDLDWIHEDRLH